MILALDQLPILEWSAEEGPGLDLALQTVGRRVLPVLVGLPGDGPHPVPAQHSTDCHCRVFTVSPVCLCCPGPHPEPQVCQHDLLVCLPSHPHKLHTLGNLGDGEWPG